MTPISLPSLRLAALATAVLLVPACTSTTREDTAYVGSSSYQLAEFTEPDGPTEIYEMAIGPSQNSAFLTIRKEAPESYQELGLEMRELDKDQAENHHPRIPPYSALLVRRVDPDSAAGRAGLKKGDLVTTVNGEHIYYLSKYHEFLDQLPPNRPVSLHLYGVEQPVELVPETRTRTARTRTNVPLERPTEGNPKPYAGVRLHVIPKEHSRRIYGDDRNAVVISGVILGSPAYLAGLRSGDIIEKVDGSPTPPLAELMRMLRDRGLRGEDLGLEVVREAGPGYAATVGLDDYSGTTRVHIPIVFNVSSSASRTNWSAVWGILANYHNNYISSETRQPQQVGSYSMLLGLIKYSWKPSGGRVRLLWFISFS